MSEILSILFSNYGYLPFSADNLPLWLVKFGGALGIFFIIFLLKNFFAKKIFYMLQRLAQQTQTQFDDFLLDAFMRPLRLFFVALGIYLALLYLPLSPGADFLSNRLFRTALIILITLGCLELVGNYRVFAEEISIKIDKILIPFLSKVLKFIIIALSLSVILQEWEYDIDGFIAGLGLGGLAFALAAQQTLANLFGGVVIITDKPFSIGDWIETPSVEGTVEDINFRSTKIRTFAQALVTIPNSSLANEPITNWSRMGKRQISFNLGLARETTREQLKECISAIKEMLRNHEGVHPETIFVNFDSFGESSLDIFLYFFTKTTKWGEYLQVKEDISLRIMSILEEHGVSLAFPSTSIYFANKLDTVGNCPGSNGQPGKRAEK